MNSAVVYWLRDSPAAAPRHEHKCACFNNVAVRQCKRMRGLCNSTTKQGLCTPSWHSRTHMRARHMHGDMRACDAAHAMNNTRTAAADKKQRAAQQQVLWCLTDVAADAHSGCCVCDKICVWCLDRHRPNKRASVLTDTCPKQASNQPKDAQYTRLTVRGAPHRAACAVQCHLPPPPHKSRSRSTLQLAEHTVSAAQPPCHASQTCQLKLEFFVRCRTRTAC